MSSIITARSGREPNIFDSPTFGHDFRIHVNETVASASISPSGRDVALASQKGLHIIDLDAPFSPPRHLRHQTPWTPADIQWSPFSCRYYWIVSTSNQRALLWNLELSSSQIPIEHTLHAHSRAITDINFSPFHPDMLATCAVDAFVHCWDLRAPARPVISFSDWYAGATQVKWNRQDSHIVASSHDKFLHIWDDRKGALPLKTIEAHETKIYGVDWSRRASSKVTTCSLDRTIKLWDYELSDTEPERIINTPFPVWRARHTPFSDCVLAMPQRGNNDLHLYDTRQDHAIHRSDGTGVEPNYSFTGHREQAKEFLWRARGMTDNNMDNRDFQLITWGADRELILHKMGPKQLQAAGFYKGMPMEHSVTLTRRGAPYKTFREKPPTPIAAAADSQTSFPNGENLLHTGTSPGMNKAPIPMGGWAGGSSRMTYSGMETRNAKHQNNDLISWMKGVRFGKRVSNDPDRNKAKRASIMTDLRNVDVEGLPENLSDEIIHVGERFTKVTFEEADVGARHVRVSLNGPWTSEGKLSFMRLCIDFPQDYPEASPPYFQLEHTSSLPEEKFVEIESGMRTIAAGYLVHRKGCLEAILSYLLGERDLHESTNWLTLGNNILEPEEHEESSSDEEDALLGESGTAESQHLDLEDSIGSGILSANANVPLPRTCGATWAANGRLVCFLPPKEEQRSILQHVAFGDSKLRGGREIFEGFGRLRTDSPDITKGKNTENEDDSESDDTSTTSSDSSSSSGGPDMVPSRFRPPAAWHGGSLRLQRMKANSTEGSLPTSNSLSRRPVYAKNKTLVVMRDVDEIIPSKRWLAQEYMIFGDGPTLCTHNAGVASKHHLPDLADIWELIKLILSNDIPLDVLSSGNGDGSILFLAQRALVQIKRKDSGLDVSFNEQDELPSAHDSALVKWGNHPLAGKWLVQKLFEHFEASADVQMLAMLSCVFAQFAVGMSLDTAFQTGMPQSMVLPAQTLDYFPTMEAALGFSEPTIAVSGSPKPFGTTFNSGSFEYRDNDPDTPFSSGITPPLLLSRGSTQFFSSNAQSLSDSPSQQRVSIPSATSSFAASVWARPFTLASSPPTRHRMSGDDLSTSTPSNGGVTWAKGTRGNTNRSDSTIRNSYTAQGLAEEYEDGSTTEEDEPAEAPTTIKLKMKNHHLFDEEATATVPFLDADQAHKHICYREAYAHMLGVWGLDMQRNEVLKYNGLVSDNYDSNSNVTRKRTDRDSQSTLMLDRADAGVTPSKEALDGPHIARSCADCLYVDVNAIGGKLDLRCQHCKKNSQILSCSICLEPINGLYKACFACGHAAHALCHQSLLQTLLDGEAKCEAGCGCACEEHANASSDFFAPEADKATTTTRMTTIAADGPSLQDARRNSVFQSRRDSNKIVETRDGGLAGEHGRYDSDRRRSARRMVN